MRFDVAIKEQDSHMRVTITGLPSFDQLLTLVHVLGLESGDWPRDKLLVDLRGVATHYSRSEQVRVGEECACSLSHMRRIASLVPPERITHNSEKAAQRNGANVCVFVDEAAALAWLEGS